VVVTLSSRKLDRRPLLAYPPLALLKGQEPHRPESGGSCGIVSADATDRIAERDLKVKVNVRLRFVPVAR
jgi:hypothetical protein